MWKSGLENFDAVPRADIRVLMNHERTEKRAVQSSRREYPSRSGRLFSKACVFREPDPTCSRPVTTVGTRGILPLLRKILNSTTCWLPFLLFSSITFICWMSLVSTWRKGRIQNLNHVSLYPGIGRDQLPCNCITQPHNLASNSKVNK